MQGRNLAILLFLTPLASNAQLPDFLSRYPPDHDRIVEEWKQTLPAPDADYGSYPADYEALVKANMENKLKDPESARYSNFSTPRKEVVIKNTLTREATYGYSVCVLVNAKNSYGAYGGNHQYWFFLRDGEILRVKDVYDGFLGSIIYQGRNVNCEDGDPPDT